MRFGPNAARIQIRRRQADADGIATGAFINSFETWAKWTQNPGVMAAVNGQREDAIDLVVTVNDCAKTRSLTNADRAVLGGDEYEIASVGLPERKSGSIQLLVKRAVNA